MSEPNLPEEKNPETRPNIEMTKSNAPSAPSSENQPPMQPVTNPQLVDAMATFKLDLSNRENEVKFLQAATHATYLIPAIIEPLDTPAEEGQKQQSRISFQVMTNAKNEKFMPAFTDDIELKKGRKPGERFQVAVMPFPDLYRFIKANEAINGVVINPSGSALCLIRHQIIQHGDNPGKIFVTPTKEEVELLRKKLEEQRAQGKEGPVEITVTPPELRQQQIQLQPQQRPANALGAPVNSAENQQDLIRQAMADLDAAKETVTEEQDAVTEDVLNALKNCLKKLKNVKKAYIAQEKEQGESYLLVAVDAEEGSIEEIGSAVSENCKDYSDLPFECVPVTSIRAKQLVAEGKPFYEKKRFGLF